MLFMIGPHPNACEQAQMPYAIVGGLTKAKAGT
jgi:hypothetical protein